MRRRRIPPVRFHWTDWNLDKVARHGLARDEVEYAWRRGSSARRRAGRSLSMKFGRTPLGRRIRIIWKWHEQFDALEPGYVTKAVLVITAY